MTEAFPLYWPEGWPRTKTYRREDSRFQPGGTAQESIYILHECERLGAQHIVISTNVELRRDGLPYSNRRQPEDPGVAVYFELDGRQQCIPCDRWRTVEENCRAVWKSIEALRGLNRWGAKSFVDAAFAGFEALPAPTWRGDLGLGADATLNDAEDSYRKRARTAHPDAGGPPGVMEALNAAIVEARLHL